MNPHAQQIQALMDTSKIIEAGSLLTMNQQHLDQDQIERFTNEIDQKRKKADSYMEQAVLAEQEGRVHDAFELVHAAAKAVADYPGIHQKMSELQDAVTLTGLVRDRSIRRQAERIRASQQKKPLRKRWWLLILVVAGLTVGLFFVQSKAPQAPAISQQGSDAPLPPQPRPTAEATDSPEPEQFTVPPTPDTQVEMMAQRPAEEPPQDLQAAPVVPIPQPADPEQVSPGTFRYYVVQEGDSLSRIAVKLFCNEAAKDPLYLMNRNQISHPDEIYPGMKIRLGTPTLQLENRCKANSP